MPVNLTPELGRAGWPADLDERARTRTPPGPKGGRKKSTVTDACPAIKLTNLSAVKHACEFIKRHDGRTCTVAGRELEALVLVAAGKRNEAIAAEMGITYDTASGYAHRLVAKLGCRDRVELAELWVRHLEATSHA